MNFRFLPRRKGRGKATQDKRCISPLRLVTLAAAASCLVSAAQNASAQTTVADFESLTIPESGFFNGEIVASTPSNISDNVEQIGSRQNFGRSETLQLVNVDGVEFFNGFTPDFGSFNGLAYSRIQNSATPGFGNQYAAFPGGGSNRNGGIELGGTYGIIFGSANPSPGPNFILPYFDLPSLSVVNSIDITNTTFAALAILNGDGPSRRFGDPPGTARSDDTPRGQFADLFQVTLTGFDQRGGTGNKTGSVTVDLADFRFATTAQDVASVLDTWLTVDLTSLGEVQSVSFRFFSSDSGTFGFNTPVYAAVDNLSFTAVTASNQCDALLGDINQDATVSFADIAPFIAVLQSGGFQCEADTNQDQAVTFADIPPFIFILQSQ
jgi:hypothetical protein